ncbi:PepSY domain-containing protein [Roseibacillus ishigakijimensis]|uniref:PepSY-associated TM region n=1 Tax=Roseibacillus ishigakijimensis TaxID=454146 RepID=A0A934RVR2_9BACT|nr:hypothetical protein [Roseibacillus ishigakijimensis]MBK1835341.1 hypothetical protein [Roseibacillus ishigakijimensis]
MRKRRRYHRWLGGALALPFFWLCLTGLVLNHTTELKLDQRFLRSPLLTGFYLDIPPLSSGRTLAVGSRHISQWGDTLFLDEAILPLDGTLVGAVPLGPHLLLATRENLYLLDANGQLIDSLGEASLPETPLLALQSHPRPLLQTATGLYQFDADLLDFPPANEKSPLPPAPWQKFTALPDSDLPHRLQASLAAQTPVSYYRVLLDLHNFSFLGGGGKFLLTLSTLALLALAASGLGLFRPRKNRPSP